LRYLGRIHSSETSQNAILSAKKYGFSNVSVDLIYGLPGQTPLEWQEDLHRAASFGPQHISVYPLTVEEGTPLYANGVRVDEDHQAELYEWTMDYLGHKGFEHYEISNWAVPGYKCRHNLIYWDNREYIGLGAAAASYLGGKRCKNCSDINIYIDRILAGGNPAEESETIDSRTKLVEDLILKLRCSSGIFVSETINHKYGATIDKFVTDNLLERCNGTIRLTRRGRILANQVMREFV